MNITAIHAGFKREIWEFNKTLFWVPVILAGLLILAPLLQLLLIHDYQFANIPFNLEKMDGVSHPEFFSKVGFALTTGLFMPFLTVAFFIQLYYFTNCLFDERRDLSIYFWRSLPVSDTQTVLTKLATGMFVVPGVFCLAATAVYALALLALLVVSTVLSVGYDISIWAIWSEANLVTNLVMAWLNILPFAIWLLPVYAWLMLASAFASRAPILWAILPVVIVLMVESFIVAYFHLDERFFAGLLLDYFQVSLDLLPEELAHGEPSSTSLFSIFTNKISLFGTIVGTVFLGATLWLRKHRSEAA
ncbi:hypothetical protein QTP81_13430 [Alteromonas sp. ASW11-36]|uniref:ABC transporter permease n=1 Tax=Alteromonas arenosi TaxID=3055817 RepID=A0ABT7SZH0_9ALTE|nr:hypothetical protein [Alteromonas sp. ASW11-36]MDM7861596.1 hypothetical protein [Alteromonas sp. ASW11-36]